MTNPEEFYRDGDYPTQKSRRRMWHMIGRGLDQKGRAFVFIPDRRSFFYGIAASILLYFAGAGIISTVRSTMVNAQPDVVRFDEAYRSAIQQFEHVVPVAVAGTGEGRQSANYFSVRREQLQKLNSAIDGMRADLPPGDLSPLKQKRLRQLYSLKLHVLQEMIENGEIDI